MAGTRYFLDTNILVGALTASRRLDAYTRDLLADRGNELLTSAVCIWEVAMKHHKKPDTTPDPIAVLAATTQFGATIVGLDVADTLDVLRLKRLHNDPFDHLILAQARRRDARLLTSDREMGRYGDDVEVVKLKP